MSVPLIDLNIPFLSPLGYAMGLVGILTDSAFKRTARGWVTPVVTHSLSRAALQASYSVS
jgi:hypothetical protein